MAYREFAMIDTTRPRGTPIPVAFVSSNDIASYGTIRFTGTDSNEINIMPRSIAPIESRFMVFLLLVGMPRLPPVPILRDSPIDLESIGPTTATTQVIDYTSSTIVRIVSVLPRIKNIGFFQHDLV